MQRAVLKRLEKLERQSGQDLEPQLRPLVDKLKEDMDTCLRAVRGQEAFLISQLGKEGTITWAGFVWLANRLRELRGQPPLPKGPYG